MRRLLGTLLCILIGSLSAFAERVDIHKLVATNLRFDKKAVFCLISKNPSIPGTAKKNDFTRLATLYNKAKKKLKRSSAQKRKLQSLKKELDSASKHCVDLTSPIVNPAPPTTPIPQATIIPGAQSLSLELFQGEMTLERVQHLLRRTTYGATIEDSNRVLSIIQSSGLEGAIDYLMQDSATPELDAEVEKLKDGDESEDHDYINPEGMRMVLLTYAQKSPNQFKERMAMFWHDLFAASHRVLDWGEMHFIEDYLSICRREAFGNVKRFALSMATNGMMLTWLDGRLNRKGKINENFAREFWELFSLGIGNYTEKDVNEAARAFTGWTVVWNEDSDRFEVAYIPARRDNLNKTIFENTPYQQTGNFGAEDIVRLTYDAHPEGAKFIVKKIFSFLVGSEPSNEIENALAAQLHATNFEIRPLVKTILLSKAFFANQIPFNKIRTPLTFLVSFHRATKLPINFWETLEFLKSTGQDPLNPPSVKGWDDNSYWLNQQWMLNRMNLANETFNYASWKFQPYSYRQQVHINPNTYSELLQQVSDRLQIQIPVEIQADLLDYLATTKKWNNSIVKEIFNKNDIEKIERKIRGLVFILMQQPRLQRE